jgi:hypothetical protein
MFKLPLHFMAILILSALDTNRERKLRVKKIYIGLIKTIREQNKRVRPSEQNESRTKSLPENCLPYAISLLAHNCKLDSLKDEVAIKQLKEFVFCWF